MGEELANLLRHPGIGVREFRQNPAALDGSCWRGAFEEYRRALLRSTEACDALHFGTFAVVAGQVVGRRAYLSHGRYLFANLYACLVGPTGRGRKSTAISLGRRLLNDVTGEDVETLATCSWEGLVDVLGEDDSTRAILIPGEFRTLAVKAKQDSNSALVPGLTELYDCPPDLRHKTRGKNVSAVRPFLSILTSSTPEWFRESFDESAISGGFLNRWVFLDGEPKPANPFPEDPDEEHWAASVEALRAMDKRLRMCPADTGRRLEMTSDAREVWSKFYAECHEWNHETELLAQMGERLQDTALKLALLYVLLEGDDAINAEQLRAGCAFARYQRSAHRRVFEGFGDSQRKRVEDRIVKRLRTLHAKGQKPTRRDLQQHIGGRGTSADEFNRALRALEVADRVALDLDAKTVELL